MVHDKITAGMRIARPAEEELASIRQEWGTLYQVDYSARDGQWAARHYSAGEQMLSASPLELRCLIAADWDDRQRGDSS